MANSTDPVGDTTEPAVVYDAGERRRHDQHAAEAYDLAGRAQHLNRFANDAVRAGYDDAAYWAEVAQQTRDSAQWHATMAVYEATHSPNGGRFAPFTPDERYTIAYCLELVADLVDPQPITPLARNLRDELTR